jgi:hypothetical protein
LPRSELKKRRDSENSELKMRRPRDCSDKVEKVMQKDLLDSGLSKKETDSVFRRCMMMMLPKELRETT